MENKSILLSGFTSYIPLSTLLPSGSTIPSVSECNSDFPFALKPAPIDQPVNRELANLNQMHDTYSQQRTSFSFGVSNAQLVDRGKVTIAWDTTEDTENLYTKLSSYSGLSRENTSAFNYARSGKPKNNTRETSASGFTNWMFPELVANNTSKIKAAAISPESFEEIQITKILGQLGTLSKVLKTVETIPSSNSIHLSKLCHDQNKPDVVNQTQVEGNILLGSLLIEASTAISGQWVAQGPGPSRFGQVENVSPNNEVSGSVHTVLAHPTNADILYIGASNGGIWRTTNATATSPNWVPLTDDLSSLSIGAMVFDAADTTKQTIVAGIGRYSSFGRLGGQRTGLLRTTDGGNTWTEIDGSGILDGKNISGIAVNGDTIVLSVNIADSYTYANVGIWRSTNGGTTFTQISTGNGAATGLPGGVSYDLAVDPNNPNILYTSTVFSSGVGGMSGVYKSTDGGANWTKVSTAAMDALITNNTSNIELAVGSSGQVYTSIINTGQLAGVFRSPSGNAETWTQLDTPKTNENGTDVGLNPRPKGPGPGSLPEEIAGGQGSIHASILADPNDPNVVYMGGDRQPRGPGDTGSWPNSIGANDFSGRLFRGNTSLSQGSQFVHLTHTQNAGGLIGGGTANNSSPHADSREMVFDANGNIIEVDDGGIYRRTSPQDNTGDWFSINGNLQVTEIHDVAYDTVSNIIISGNQDTGTTQQTASGSTTWDSVSTADGGDVAVSVDPNNPNQSIRYSSFQNLGAFRKRTYNAAGGLVSEVFPSLSRTDGTIFAARFVTPLEVNAIDPNRLLIGGDNSGTSGVYESLDQGNNITKIGPGISGSFEQNAMVYGGRSGGVNNPNLVYYGSADDIFSRTTAGVSATATGFNSVAGTGRVQDLTIDSDEWRSVFAIDENQIFQSSNQGTDWSEITGDLLTEFGNTDIDLNSIEFIPGPTLDALVLATNRGIFSSISSDFTDWLQLGTGLPNAPVWDLDYDLSDDLLVAGTLGRGAWTFPNLSDALGLVPTVTLSVSPSSVTENSTSNLIYTFSRTTPTSSSLDVNFTLGGTATQPGLTGSDYSVIGGTLAGANGTITFEAGSATASFTVIPTGDTTPEPNETVALTLATGTGYTIGTPDAVTGTITNDDLPALSINNARVIEGQSPNAVVTVNLSASSSQTITVQYATANTTAQAGSDYTTTTGTLTFTPGQTSRTINIPIVNNNSSEVNETFQVNLSDPTNATIIDNQGIVTISDTLTSGGATTLSAAIENLQLTGTANINGTGNANGNLITGNSGSNILSGLNGNDSLNGAAGNDSLSGAADNDSLIGGGGNDSLSGGAGNDTLVGGPGKDILTGSTQADTFNYTALSESLLATFDVIKDYSGIGTSPDRLNAPAAIPAVNLTTSKGTAADLSAAAIQTVLTNAAFSANTAAAFKVTGQTGTFIAFNNGTLGFQSTSDAILHLEIYNISAANPVVII